MNDTIKKEWILVGDNFSLRTGTNKTEQQNFKQVFESFDVILKP